jgi:hypothetical protein
MLFFHLVILFLNPVSVQNLTLTNISSNLRLKATAAFVCPSATPDTADCTTKFNAVKTQLDLVEGATPPFVQADAEKAVNDFALACGASKCLGTCQATAAEKALTGNAALSSADFATACTPDASPVYTTLVNEALCGQNPENDEKTCATAYTATIAAATTSQTSPWSSTNVQTAINSYITACKKTACSKECNPIVSSQNVKFEYTNLKDNLTNLCNPIPPTAEPQNDSAQSSIGGRSFVSLIVIALFTLGLLFK